VRPDGGRGIIALDIGTVRIGVAASDPSGLFAQGIVVLAAAGDWMGELDAIVSQRQADTMIVGMPRRTDGTDGPEAAAVWKVIERLRARYREIEIIPWDERFTTTIATRALIEADVSRKGRRERVDKVAAAILLQGYLDSLQTASGGESLYIGAEDPGVPAHRGRREDRGGRGKRCRER
jgi:putative Holliday junction resolvase